MNQSPDKEPQTLGFFQLLTSVLSAFFGVQSNAARERDFSQGKISHFILIGLLMGLLFIAVVISVVYLVIHLAGA